MIRSLGRLTPDNFDHIAAKPLSAAPPTVPTPATIGTLWFPEFDTPKQTADGSWHLPFVKEIKSPARGGHCTCLAAMGQVKLLQAAWQTFYNQGQEGACEGFGHAHAQTLIHGVTYDALLLYDEARKMDGTYPEGEGTTNHSVVRVLEADGIRPQKALVAERNAQADGPAEKLATVHRWTQDTQEVLTALGRPGAWAVPLLNSWGTDYPQVVWLPSETLDFLLREAGEADVVTDL